MTTISSLNRTTPATASTAAAGAYASTSSPARASGGSASTVVSLGGAADGTPGKALLWENRTRSTSAMMMAQNFNSEPAAGRLKGLGGELLKQVAYDGEDFSQTVQQAPSGVQVDTYDMLVSSSPVSQHGMGDNQISLSITTRSGVKVELKLDAGDHSIAVEARSDGKLNETERKALGKLSEAFQQSIDALTEDPPRIDLAGLTQFDQGALTSVDLKGSIKVSPKETQRLEFHADATQRSVNFSGPAGSANIAVDLSQPAAWGSKAQQATALQHTLQQLDQAGQRGQGNATMIAMFKDAFTDMNSDYGTPAVVPLSTGLTDRDRTLTTGLADFKASFAQTEVSSNPARVTEKDSFAYEVSQKTTISGSSPLDRGIAQQQQSHLKARFHSPVSADALLALDLEPQSQNYKYHMIDDAASSSTTIKYDQGVLAEARLEMQASQSSRVLKYMLGKLQDDHTTPSGKVSSRDLLAEMNDAEDAQALAVLNQRIFLQSNPDAIPSDDHEHA